MPDTLTMPDTRHIPVPTDAPATPASGGDAAPLAPDGATAPLAPDGVKAPLAPAYDVAAVRKDFPILTRTLHERPGRPGRPGKPLVYLDNAASTQKPRSVITAITHFLEHDYANVHRGIHTLSQRATDTFEAARDTAAAFLGAGSREEIVFTRGATEAINLVAAGFGRAILEPGDEVVVSVIEHHANIVPWQLMAEERGVRLKVVPCDDRGVLDLDAYVDLLGGRTRLVALTHGSNVLGTITPAAELARLAHERGIPILFDGSQAAVHQPVDVQAIDADFYVCTGHKLYGPTAIGLLYGRREWLARLPPYQGGGDMIASVSFAGTRFRDPPQRFEAGTPPILEAVGLAAALRYIENLGRPAIAAHEQRLLARATAGLMEIDGIRLIGTAPGKAAILSFLVDGVHAHDVGMLLDQAGIAVRVGLHCAEPLAERFGVGATVRASFALYTTEGEVDALVQGVKAVIKFFR